MQSMISNSLFCQLVASLGSTIGEMLYGNTNSTNANMLFEKVKNVGLVAGWPKQKAGGRMHQPAGLAGPGRTGLTERSEVRYG